MRTAITLTLLLAPLISFKALSATDQPACQRTVTEATYTQPTKRYRHGVLGDEIEYGGLKVGISDCAGSIHYRESSLPITRVFEDLHPRLVDLDGDQNPEIMTVESSSSEGARLAVWGIQSGELQRIAATPYIGRAFRWLAPIGAADFDNDGHVEIAYIDRPHLAQTLRIWRYQNGLLTQIAQRSGLTNHRIGEDFISGGVRDCGRGPEMITADGSWSKVMATRFDDGELVSESLGRFKGAESFEVVLGCDGPK